MDTLTRTPNNGHYASNLLFDFHSLVDTDIGMIKYFKLNFPDSKFVDKDILKNNDIKFYQALLLERMNPNPLSIIIKPEYLDQIDNLYDEVYNANHLKILLLSTELAFNRIISHTKAVGFITNTIMCKNEYEEQYCKKVYPNINTVLRSNKDFSVNDYDALYLKDIRDLNLMKKNTIREIYLLSYAFNMEKGIQGLPRLDVYGKMLSSLKLHLAMPYSDYIKPI